MSENYLAIPDDESEGREIQRMPSPRELVEIVEKRDEFIAKAVPIINHYTDIMVFAGIYKFIKRVVCMHLQPGCAKLVA